MLEGQTHWGIVSDKILRDAKMHARKNEEKFKIPP
jgi:hypothetical protein